jgi:membrane-associated phospholipid phosphatase
MRAVFWISLSVLFVIALFLDAPVAHFVDQIGMSQTLKAHSWLTHILRIPGHFGWYTAVICVFLLCMGRQHWESALAVFTTGVFAGSNWIIKWIVGRTRPLHGVPPWELHPFEHGLRGLFAAERALSFPSGDVCLAAAMAVALGRVWPKQKLIWWVLVVVVAAERLAEGAHYPSDVVAGTALGIAMAIAARKVLARWPIIRQSSQQSPGQTVHVMEKEQETHE